MKKDKLVTLGLTEEQALKIETAIIEFLKGDGDHQKSYIPYSRFKEVNDEKTALKESLKERDVQLEELKKSTNIEGLQKQIEELQALNTQKEAEHAAAIEALKIETATEAALTAAKAKNIKAVKALLDLEGVELTKDGTIKGLEEQVKKLMESEDTGFLFDAESVPPPFNPKGAKPAESRVENPDGKVDLSKMTYEELAAYMESNPNAVSRDFN